MILFQQISNTDKRCDESAVSLKAKHIFHLRDDRYDFFILHFPHSEQDPGINQYLNRIPNLKSFFSIRCFHVGA